MSVRMLVNDVLCQRVPNCLGLSSDITINRMAMCNTYDIR